MKKINVYINSYLEYMNSILLTSRYNEITEPYIGYGLMTKEENEYTTRIKHFLEKYRNDDIYQYIESLVLNGFTFSRPVELMLSLGNNTDFSMQYTPSEMCIEYCGGISNIKELLRLLKEYEAKIGFFAFLEEAKEYYNPIIEQAKEIVNKYPYISILEDEYGKEQNSYNYILSSLMIGNYGISFGEKGKAKLDIFSVFATDGFSISEVVLFHEFSHPFINPLTEKYIDLVTKYQSSHELLKKYKLPGFKSGYGDWCECVNEHLVRAMVIHLLQKCNLQDMATKMLDHDLCKGYKYIPLILEKYKYYDNHRDIYPDFETFYPTLLEVFSNIV